jgi:hypothetical protein
MKKYYVPAPNRWREIGDLRAKGLTYAQIGKIYDVTGENIRQILCRYNRLIAKTFWDSVAARLSPPISDPPAKKEHPEDEGVLKFIIEFQASNAGKSPNLKQIISAMGFKGKGYYQVYGSLERLEMYRKIIWKKDIQVLHHESNLVSHA